MKATLTIVQPGPPLAPGEHRRAGRSSRPTSRGRRSRSPPGTVTRPSRSRRPAASWTRPWTDKLTQLAIDSPRGHITSLDRGRPGEGDDDADDRPGRPDDRSDQLQEHQAPAQGVPEAEGADLDRRLDALRQVLELAQDRCAAQGAREERDRLHEDERLRRDRPRLGVPRLLWQRDREEVRRGQQRPQPLLAGRQTQPHALAEGAAQPARRPRQEETTPATS